MWPCGLKAASTFNDTYVLKRRKDSKLIEIQENGIAWDSDLKWLKNPAAYPDEANVRWLCKRFPNITGLDAAVAQERARAPQRAKS